MYLTRDEERILVGEEGQVRQKALEILVALGEIFEADRLISVNSVQVAGVSYKTLGEAGLEWIESLSMSRVCVPTTLNPAGMDLELWERMKIPKDFAERQIRVIHAFRKLGITPICTCTPYLLGSIPRLGEHIAWSESSAVCFANSVLGAKTNREGGPSALASALTGRTANYGYHLDENRMPTLKVRVKTRLAEESDFGALGYHIGRIVGSGVPYFTGIGDADTDMLKALGAALAASGSVTLYHMEGITPESSSVRRDGVETISFAEEDLRKAYSDLNTVGSGKVDLVCFGCPHASIEEVRRVAEALKGRKVAPHTKLWVFTSIGVKSIADRCGYTHIIEEAGGEVYSDCCMIVTPVEEMSFHSIAVNSAKAAVYAPTTSKVNVTFGTLRKCIEIATSGRVE